MLHHLSFAVSDLERAAAFYDATLGSLGYVRVWTAKDAIGYGMPGGGDKFAIKTRAGKLTAPGEGFHAAFAAPNPAAVEAWYALAIAHGARDNGAPGLRPHYGPDYYAAFVVDPDGYRIEAVINPPGVELRP